MQTLQSTPCSIESLSIGLKKYATSTSEPTAYFSAMSKTSNARRCKQRPVLLKQKEGNQAKVFRKLLSKARARREHENYATYGTHGKDGSKTHGRLCPECQLHSHMGDKPTSQTNSGHHRCVVLPGWEELGHLGSLVSSCCGLVHAGNLCALKFRYCTNLYYMKPCFAGKSTYIALT